MKKFVLIPSILLLLICNGFLLYKVKEIANDNLILQRESQSVASNFQVIEEIKRDLINAITINYEINEDEIKYNGFNKEDSVSFYSGFPKLVFQFNKRISCTPCIDDQLVSLKKLSREIGDENIILLPIVENERDLFTLKETKNLNFKIFDVKPIIGNFHNVSMPAFYIIDKDLKMHDIFVPLSALPDLTDSYFSVIKEKYFIK